MNKSDRISVRRIVGTYFLLSCLWIFLSDRILEMFVRSVATVTLLSVVKGFVFVVITAFFLYRLVIRHLQAVRDANERALELNQALEERNAELDAERAYWRRAIEGIADEVWISDSRGRMSLVNLPDETQMGLKEFQDRSVEEVLEEVEILHPDGKPRPPADAPLLRSLRGEIVLGEEIMLHRATGKQRYRQFSSAPMHGPAGEITGAIAIVRDITERKEMEKALEEAKMAAEEANRAKSRFLANMSHELRTPMTGVLGMMELALAGPIAGQQREFIAMAHKSARSLLRILNDILDLTRVEAGKMAMETKPFDLRECVAGAVDILIPEARRKGLELSYTVADDLPVTLKGDRIRLQQVLSNLCGNAVKFTEKGKVTVQVAATGQQPGEKREITFTVTDTGIGIPEDKRHLIFTPFTQVDDSDTRRYGGTGLGLAISREIVERMGGAITFENREGEGSVFTVIIPFDAASDDRQGEGTPGRSDDVALHAVTAKKGRILVVEDDPITRQVIELMLERSSFSHDVAENGRQAVGLWEKEMYDVVLMDVQMPVLDGFEATRAIREKEREQRGGHTIIVAMTAHAYPEDEKRCLEAGMDAYIPKPLDLKKCMETIEGLLTRKRPKSG